MLGLALMAVDLAVKRTGYGGPQGVSPRSNVQRSPRFFAFSAEYYRIIDRLSRGEKP